jgi:hypothetical protein
MSTLIAIANQIAKSFLNTRNKKHAANHIIYEVSSLVYLESKHPLEYSEKAAIIQLIDEFISGKRSFQLKKGEFIITQPRDSRMFLQRKEYILNHVNIRKEQKQKIDLIRIGKLSLIKKLLVGTSK